VALPRYIPGHTVTHGIVETDRRQQRVGADRITSTAGRATRRLKATFNRISQLLWRRVVALNVTHDGASVRITYGIHRQEHTVYADFVVNAGTFVRLTALPRTTQAPVVRQDGVETDAPGVSAEHA